MPAGVGRTPKLSVSSRVHLVGDGIERPANARALMDAAAMFQAACAFRDTCGLAARWSDERAGPLPLVETTRLLAELLPIVAVENTPGAAPVYDAGLPPGRPTIVVGGERRGVRGDVLRAATRRVEIPMRSRRVNTLNVAAAAAVALFYLTSGRRHGARQSVHPERRRPALLLLSPDDHVEAGSTIRSAAAFGWSTVGLDDRRCVWFGAAGAAVAEGRAAARSHRNAIRVTPMPAAGHLGFSRVVIAGARVDGPPLHRVDLAGGRSTLLVLPDEEVVGTADWGRLGGRVELARVPLPATIFPYRYRLVASIVLAEVARQVGVPAGGRRRPFRPRNLTYESAFDTTAVAPAEVVTFQQLRAY
jgi:tRNA G18 (ribose-2'-O)-methylase SpoU